MDPNTILTELQIQKADETETDGEEIYYTILQDDAEEENLTLKTEEPEFLDTNNIFYLSFKDDDQEESGCLPQQEEENNTADVSAEESNVNMEFLEQITLPDGTQAYMKREQNGILDDDKLLRIQSESFEMNEDIFQNFNRDFDNKDSSDEELTLDNEEFGNNLVFTQANDDDNATNYEQIQLEDGTIAMIEKDLYNKIVEQNKKKEASKSNEQASTSSGTSKTFKCPQEDCTKSYTTLHHLRVHMRTHTGHKPYKCSIDGCDKTFSVGYSLKAHSRTHTGEKPYGCQTCLKRFKTSGDLQKHNRIHTGEKPFLCPIEGCGRSFTTSNIRKVHIRSHTGERPYKCPETGCNKAFASATNYKNHIRIHSGERPYQCLFEGCGKRFTEYSSLYKHQTVHSNSKACRCEYCGKDFRQPSTLVSHKRTMHNIIITENGTEIMVKMVDQETEEEEEDNNVEEQGLGEGEMQFFFVAQTE